VDGRAVQDALFSEGRQRESSSIPRGELLDEFPFLPRGGRSDCGKQLEAGG
jgi:hypothetical protein